jgi:predicted enzyme related to lactoylglutathione lyase
MHSIEPQEGNPVKYPILITAILLAVGAPAAATGKALPIADVGAGRVAWFDITTTDLSRSKTFYGKLFNWKFTPVTGTDQAAEIVSRGRAIGTLRVADGAIGSFNGVVYVQVNDVAAAAKQAKELGGTVVPGFPFNLPDGRGAIAVIGDPSGHPVGMYSKALLPPAAASAK